MKKITNFLSLPLLALGLLSVPAQAEAKGEKLPARYDYAPVGAYFADYLGGDEAPFVSPYTLKPGRTAEVKADVWEQWRKTNAEFDEERLPEVIPSLDGFMPTLKDDHAYRWQLPAELEPKAVMPFFFGIKGQREARPEGKLPLFLYLHGSGPKYPEWINGLKLGRAFDDGPSVYVIPQIPNVGQYYRWWQKSKQWAWRKLLRQTMLRSDSIDPNAIYIFGISEGGYGSQRLASFYADYLAGAGPMAGGEPLINAPAENLRNIAFSFQTGENDGGFLRNRLTRITGEALDSLSALYPGSYVHKVEIQPGRGHGIDYSPTTPWLSKFRRDPRPKHVSWENFEMDGLYRDGFYNLYVNTRSNPDQNSRTVYTMDINGNEIDVTVRLVSYDVTESDRSFGFPIGLRFAKSYTPATSGNFTIYLDDSLVDLGKKVCLRVNGKEVFNGKPVSTLENLVNSCARFYDPERLFPAAITVDLDSMTAE